MVRLVPAVVLAALAAASAAAEGSPGASCPEGSGAEACARAAAAGERAAEEEGMAVLQLKQGQEGSDSKLGRKGGSGSCGPKGCPWGSDGPIYVLTDMGFDDWGAFSILHASGHDPEAILTVSGMMQPSSFSANFSQLLRSWGVTKPVIYQSTDGCHHDCLNSSFIESNWHYPHTVQQYWPNATAKPPGQLPPGKVTDGSQFPWMENCKEKYRLLLLGPMSQFDYKAWEDPHVMGCISEVVVSGGFFADSEQGRTMAVDDINTWDNLIPLSAGNLAIVDYTAFDVQFEGPPKGGADSSTLRELNVVSDALAAARVLATAARMGVKITIIPLEVESINRYGMQVIQKSDLTYTDTKQADITDEFILKNFCRRGQNVQPGNKAAGMLQRMACINEPVLVPGNKNITATQYTMDMDAIVATYFWEPNLFTFDKHSLVAFDSRSGQTYSACERVAENSCLCEGESGVLSCFKVQRATDFDAQAWFEKLNELFDWRTVEP